MHYVTETKSKTRKNNGKKHVAALGLPRPAVASPTLSQRELRRIIREMIG